MGGEDKGQVEGEAGDEGALDLLQFLSVPHDGGRLLGEPGQHVVSHWSLQEKEAAFFYALYADINIYRPQFQEVYGLFFHRFMGKTNHELANRIIISNHFT